MYKIKTYEVVIEETHTHIVRVLANNKGMAKIRAKLAAKGKPGEATHVTIASCEVVAEEQS